MWVSFACIFLGSEVGKNVCFYLATSGGIWTTVNTRQIFWREYLWNVFVLCRFAGLWCGWLLEMQLTATIMQWLLWRSIGQDRKAQDSGLLHTDEGRTEEPVG